MSATATLQPAVLARVKKPRTRGVFIPVDAARRQLGLLAVSDSTGQGRIYWLVDLATTVIEDARFLAFGDLSSHAVLDAFTELARGRTVADAGRLSAEQVESLLRGDDGGPAFGDEGLAPLAFLRELQDLAEAELPRLALLPKPVDAPAYVRKRKADWSAEDERWLPLNLLRKSALVEQVLGDVLSDRVGRAGVRWRLDAINDDFIVRIRFDGLPAEEVPTLCQFLQDALRGRIHPAIVVEAVP
jgi:NifU-like protein involved in Fe-S cluster formation